MLGLIDIMGSALLFSLVFGMSATVDTRSMARQIQNRDAILTGVVLQFLVLPPSASLSSGLSAFPTLAGSPCSSLRRVRAGAIQTGEFLSRIRTALENYFGLCQYGCRCSKRSHICRSPFAHPFPFVFIPTPAGGALSSMRTWLCRSL